MSEQASQKQHRGTKEMQTAGSSAQQRPQPPPNANWVNQRDTALPSSEVIACVPYNQPVPSTLATTLGSQCNSSQSTQPPHYPQHQYNFHSGFHNLVAAAATIAHQSQEIRNYPSYDHHHYATQSWPPSYTQLLPAKRSYANGVDELILAAKIEESSSRAAISSGPQIVPSSSLVTTSAYSGYPSNNTTCQSAQQTAFVAPYIPYVPTGRGLGYPHFSSTLSIDRDSIIQMPTPRTKSELELYSLLEKANLLQYFEIFLKFGGDDVQQLSDADEEEFIEIMTLIGMTNKPLHIRRLQKALSDWREIRGARDSIGSSLKRLNVEAKLQEERSPSCGGQTLYPSQYSTDRISRPSVFMVESPMHTPTDSEISQPSFAPNEKPQQQFCTPLEVIVGAPKRPRLMDSIKPRDLTKTYHSDIPTPDVRQLNVRQAIIDKRKRVKMGLEQNPRTSALSRSYDDDIKLTPTSNSPPSPNWNVSESSCGPFDESDGEREHEHKRNESLLQTNLAPKKRPSARTSLLSRFNNSSDEGRSMVQTKLTSSPPVPKP